MELSEQKVLPAIRDIKDFEKVMSSNYEYIVVLDTHVSRLKPLFQLAKVNQKKIIIHLDLVQGLKSDEYSTEYVCQEFKPFGLISTKGSVIKKARQKGVTSIQRIFLLDSSSMERSYDLIKNINPDYIEVLPGLMPKIIKDIHDQTNKGIFTGGFIDTIEEVEQAFAAGAIGITTSRKDLWKYYEPGKGKN